MIPLELSFRAVAAARPGIVFCYHTLRADELSAQLDLFGRFFDFIHHDELPERMSGRRSGRPFCLLTFDDGKRSHLAEVAPLLSRLGIPAVFYIVTDAATRPRDLLWFDRLTLLQQHFGELPAALDRRRLKAIRGAERERLIEEHWHRARPRVDPGDDDIGLLDWDGVRALAKEGFTIGSHTRRHAILTREHPEDAKRDIAESIDAVRREVGTCDTFCFPNGNYTDSLARHAAACGAATVMTTEPTWVSGRSQSWRVPRVQLHPNYSPEREATKVLAAASGVALVNPDGTGRTYLRRKLSRLIH